MEMFWAPNQPLHPSAELKQFLSFGNTEDSDHCALVRKASSGNYDNTEIYIFLSI